MAVLTEIAVGDHRVEALVARPTTTGAPWPGVLLFMDAFGLRPQIARMADRVASWGYLVLAPNTLYRGGTVEQLRPAGDLHDPAVMGPHFARVKPMIAALDAEAIAHDGPAYTAALRAQTGVREGGIGVVGYCMGARVATRVACLDPTVVACAGFHGGGLATDAADSPHRSLPSARAAFLYGHADSDAGMDPQAQVRLTDALDAAGLRYRADVYEGASHGYTMADSPMYDEAASERHFGELRELFAATLAG